MCYIPECVTCNTWTVRPSPVKIFTNSMCVLQCVLHGQKITFSSTIRRPVFKPQNLENKVKFQ